jgi:uncharacterized protein
MELVEDKYINDFSINKYIDNTIVINNFSHKNPIIYNQREIILFPVIKSNLIQLEDIESYLDTIDMILIGTGIDVILPDEGFIRVLHEKNKGLEFMNTTSACKTHNLLLSENRSFISILYP